MSIYVRVPSASASEVLISFEENGPPSDRVSPPSFRLIRPVGNNTDRLTVKMGIKMSQIIGIDMKRQIMITNVWVEQEWIDYKLKWDPADYGGVKHLHVPSNDIWLPDIVLYNK